MSKKNKKFKRNKSRHGYVAPAHIETTAKAESPESEGGIDNAADQTVEKAKKVEEDPYASGQYDHVRKDVKKILFIISILVLIFVAVWLVGAKTNLLTSIGDWIYKIANIQTQ